MNLNLTVGQTACQLLHRYTQTTVCFLLLLNCTNCYVWLHQKKLWLFMFEIHLIIGITDGWQGCEPPSPVKLNVKTGPFLACISAWSIYYSFGFSRLSFFRFSEYFPVISGFCIAVQYWIFNCFSTIFWVLGCGLPSAKFPRGSNL